MSSTGQHQHLFLGPLSGMLILLVLRSIYKFSGIELLLGDLRAFYPQDPGPSAGQLGDPRTRKGRKQAAKQQVLLKGQSEQNACMVPVSTSVIKTITFAKDFDDLVLVSALVLINALVALMVAWLMGGGGNASMSVITVFVLIFAVLTSAKVDLGSDSGNLGDKVHLLVAAALGAAASAYLLWPLAPSGLLVGDFGFGAAKGAIDQATASILQQLQSWLGASGVDLKARQQGPLLLLGLCLFAGFMAASLFGPATRYAKDLFSISQVPHWGVKYLSPPRTALWVARLGVVAPLLVVLLQVQPVVQLWGVPPSWQPQLFAAALLLTALSHAWSIHPLCQAWLNTGLTTWYVNRHSGIDHPRKVEMLRLRLSYVRALLCRTAVQVATLAVVATAAAVLVALHGQGGLLAKLSHPSARSGPLAAWEALKARTGPGFLGATEQANATALGSMPAPLPDPGGAEPLQGFDEEPDSAGMGSPAGGATGGEGVGVLNLSPLFVFVGQYYGWWACLVWSVVACGTLAVQRLGLNSA